MNILKRLFCKHTYKYFRTGTYTHQEPDFGDLGCYNTKPAIMKSYTDIEQSKKLAEILPIESADMHYSKDFDGSWFVDLAKYTSVKIPKYVGNIEEHLLPCWSLAALLSVLPKSLIYTPNPISDGYSCKNIMHDLETYGDNPIDVCYEMILELKENNLL